MAGGGVGAGRRGRKTEAMHDTTSKVCVKVGKWEASLRVSFLSKCWCSSKKKKLQSGSI